MMNSDTEVYIRQNCPWSKLPPSTRQLLGDSQREYEKLVLHFSIKNQLCFRGNIVRTVKKDERLYYDELLRYSREHLMLYPYHLSDFIVTGMRITPFQYYTNMMQDLMEQEKSYDALPNFTAADCLRLLGIGRNQYIELMNQCRSKTFFGVRRRPVRELLPSKPIASFIIEPWWLVQVGYVTEDDIRMVSKEEKMIIDKIIDNGAQRAGDLDAGHVKALYRKGLVYLDVPIDDDDCVIVPPLEGFVMNRVLGDYFETLLYKIFISIDEHTTVSELSSILQIDPSLVKNAVSMYCRLGIAHKKGKEDNATWHPSWKKGLDCDNLRNLNVRNFILSLKEGSESESTLSNASDTSLAKATEEDVPLVLTTSSVSKRIGFLFDSTLTAFLMMGNLSPGLKSHAVTMFEVGKLPDESLDSFLAELLKVADIGEGEARRYFDHALTLRDTIMFLRHNSHVLPPCEMGRNGVGLDLIRCESLQNLDQDTCSRLLKKNYWLLISMAPLSNEIRPVSSCKPPHLGPPIPEVNSIWFKFFLYSLTKHGPPSLLLARGTRLQAMPKVFWDEEKLLVTTWAHDPSTIPASNALPTINDALCHSPVLIQKQGSGCEFQYIPFPLDDKCIFDASKKGLSYDVMSHPAILALGKEIDLEHSSGYITMMHIADSHDSKGYITSDEEKNFENSTKCESSSTFLSSQSDMKIEFFELPLATEFGKLDNIHSEEWFPSVQSEIRYLNENSTSEVYANEVNNSQLYQCSFMWTILDCTFGIPLFDSELNKEVCQKIVDKNLCWGESLSYMIASNERLCLRVLDFVSKYQVMSNSESGQSFPFITNISDYDTELPLPSENLFFSDGKLNIWSGS